VQKNEGKHKPGAVRALMAQELGEEKAKGKKRWVADKLSVGIGINRDQGGRLLVKRGKRAGSK